MTAQQRRKFESLLCAAADCLVAISIPSLNDAARLPDDASPHAVFARMKSLMPSLELRVSGSHGERVWAAVVSIGAGSTRWRHCVKLAEEATGYRLPGPAAMDAVRQIDEAFLRTRLRLQEGPPKPTREMSDGLRAWPMTLLAPEQPPTRPPAELLDVQRLASNTTKLRCRWIALAKSLDAEPAESWTIERATELEMAPEVVAAWLVGGFVPLLTIGNRLMQRSTFTAELRRGAEKQHAARGPARMVPVETLIVIRFALEAFVVALDGGDIGAPPVTLNRNHVESGPAVRFVRAVLGRLLPHDVEHIGDEGIRRVARDMRTEAEAHRYALRRAKRRKSGQKSGSN